MRAFPSFRQTSSTAAVKASRAARQDDHMPGPDLLPDLAPHPGARLAVEPPQGDHPLHLCPRAPGPPAAASRALPPAHDRDPEQACASTSAAARASTRPRASPASAGAAPAGTAAPLPPQPPACRAQVVVYNMMGWPLPVEPKKDDDEVEGAGATKELTAGAEGTELRRRKTTGGVTKVASDEQWRALQQVCRTPVGRRVCGRSVRARRHGGSRWRNLSVRVRVGRSRPLRGRHWWWISRPSGASRASK